MLKLNDEYCSIEFDTNVYKTIDEIADIYQIGRDEIYRRLKLRRILSKEGNTHEYDPNLTIEYFFEDENELPLVWHKDDIGIYLNDFEYDKFYEYCLYFANTDDPDILKVPQEYLARVVQEFINFIDYKNSKNIVKNLRFNIDDWIKNAYLILVPEKFDIDDMKLLDPMCRGNYYLNLESDSETEIYLDNKDDAVLLKLIYS